MCRQLSEEDFRKRLFIEVFVQDSTKRYLRLCFAIFSDDISIAYNVVYLVIGLYKCMEMTSYIHIYSLCRQVYMQLYTYNLFGL